MFCLDPFESFYKPLTEGFKDSPFNASFKTDSPAGKGVWWFLDIILGESMVVVQWSDGKGYGVSKIKKGKDEIDFTHQADETFETDKEALARVIQLLTA
jgi:hypothetical protein